VQELRAAQGLLSEALGDDHPQTRMVTESLADIGGR
jgi:hypothetical protein